MIYIDTSAALLVLLDQGGAASVEDFLSGLGDRERVVSSVLLRIEMSRALRRERLSLTIAQDFLDGVELVAINDVVERACSVTGELKSLDAIHLATALLLDDPRDPVTVLTHDARLLDAARGRGLTVIDPLEP